MALSFKDVAEILKIIDSSSCEEVVLEIEGTRLVVRRGSNSGEIEKTITQPTAGAELKTAGSLPKSDSVLKKKSHVPDVSKTEGATVFAPMVGTFFRKPSPEAPPFVEEGDSVKIGDPLCLIEVMKLYTTIESSMDGIIHGILVKDGELVEFDQPLFVIRDG